MGKEDREVDPKLVRALGHPLRVQILRLLSEGPSSPKQMSDSLGEALSNVSYHTKVLLELDCIELVKTRPARGAVEHIYRAKPKATLGSSGWQQVPPTLRGEVAAAALDAFTSRAVAALESGTFQEREGSSVSWFPLTVDETGWAEIRRVLGNIENRFRAVAEKSQERLGDSDPGLPVVVAVAAFGAAGSREAEGA
jgi:DNA-binding transcriptional ArsR family regulator